ncbi:uncharacterized protein LOC144319168 [Canis aureus]
MIGIGDVSKATSHREPFSCYRTEACRTHSVEFHGLSSQKSILFPPKLQSSNSLCICYGTHFTGFLRGQPSKALAATALEDPVCCRDQGVCELSGVLISKRVRKIPVVQQLPTAQSQMGFFFGISTSSRYLSYQQVRRIPNTKAVKRMKCTHHGRPLAQGLVMGAEKHHRLKAQSEFVDKLELGGSGLP